MTVEENNVVIDVDHVTVRFNMATQKIDNLKEYNIPVTLVMTLERDLNDMEIGKVITYGLETSNVRGVNIQPVAYFGRKTGNIDRKNRVTLTDTIRLIEEQTKKMIVKEDFVPLPCNVERVALTYLYKTKNGFLPITRTNNIKKVFGRKCINEQSGIGES